MGWLLGFLLVGSVLGQSGGKLTGRVVDTASGAPLVGANVVVRATNFGASTDVDGRFIILGLPPGNYEVETHYIGFQRTLITDVKILTALTTQLSIEMSEQLLEASEEIVVVGKMPMVRKDLTSVEARVDAEELGRMPVESLGDVLNMQAGVTRDEGGGIHIRGGRSSEVAYMVNGISITDDYNKSQSLTIETDAIQELQVISGTFNAEFGNAMSGIVNIVTKGGSDDFRLHFSSEMGDYVSGHTDLFWHIDDHDLLQINSLQLSASGPLISNRLSYFAMGRRYQNQGWIYGARYYEPQGRVLDPETNLLVATGDSSAVPMNDQKRASGQFNLKWNLSPAFSLKLDLIGSRSRDRDYSHFYRLNPDGYGYTESYGSTGLLSFTHQLNAKSFHQASLAFKRNGNSYSLYDDPADSRFVHPDSALTPDYHFSTAGNDLWFSERETNSQIFRWDLTWQVNWMHQLKTGIELQRDDIFFENYELLPTVAANGVQLTPFQPSVADISQSSHNRFTRSPDKLAIYVQDKIEHESVIMNIGLRIDQFRSNGRLPMDRTDPSIYSPFKLTNVYADLDQDGVIDLSEQNDANRLTVGDREDGWWQDAEKKLQISPRFGIAYPITDEGVIHFSYGIFQQIPEYSLLFYDDEYKLPESVGTYGPFGNPDLNPQRTSMYELGISQQITPDMSINVTGFYRDIRDWISASPPIPTVVAGVSYSTWINRDFANVRGITLMLDRRLAKRFEITADYTYQIVEGTNSAPEDEFWAQLDGSEPTRQLAPLNWDQRHTLNLNSHISFEHAGASLLYRYNSGQPYTPEILTGERTGRSIIMGLAENSRRKPARTALDLNAYRSFQTHWGQATVTLTVLNVLDAKNPMTVYADSGEADYTARQDQVVEADTGYFVRPDFYSEPRQITIGFSYDL